MSTTYVRARCPTDFRIWGGHATGITQLPILIAKYAVFPRKILEFHAQFLSFWQKKKFSRFARKRSSEAQFRKQIRGERRFPTPPPSAGTPPFSLESGTLVAEKQGNSAFKHIPHLFSVKPVAKPRYATFLKIALKIAYYVAGRVG